jgi:hypothetical protein
MVHIVRHDFLEIVFPPPSYFHGAHAALADFDHRYNAVGGNITYQRKVREIGQCGATNVTYEKAALLWLSNDQYVAHVHDLSEFWD